jgi:WXG100 family type VII secretion target
MSMPIQVNYAAMEEAASVIQSSSRTIEEKLNELDSQLKKIAWEGSDREAYMAHKAKWDQAIADMNQILLQIGGAVTTAREGYGQTEQAGVNAWQ